MQTYLYSKYSFRKSQPGRICERRGLAQFEVAARIPQGEGRRVSGARNPAQAAVPLAMLMVAGLVHAGLEDWIFAPGYYLCVFYWAMAFIFVDRRQR